MTGHSPRRAGLALFAPVLASVTAVAMSACGSGTDNTPTAVPTLTGDCAAFQPYAGHAGKTVGMFASIVSPESDSLQRSWAKFSECTGIKISYEGANEFESQLPLRVSGGNPPDLAVIPQPGLLKKMVQTRKVVKPSEQTVKNVDKYWSKDWKNYGTVDGLFYAAPMSANMKSLVWYSPKAFAAAGYTVPKTWDELIALSDKIAKAGKNKPWCGGIGSGTATGWPATDWLEQVVLRKLGGETYDKWVSHEVTFSSPEIIGAMQILADWMHNPDWVNGGFGDVKTIATVDFKEAGKPILTGKCSMLQQASFYGAQWPKGTRIGEKGDVYAFFLPTINSSVTMPVVGGGEFLTAFSDRPEVRAVQEYLSDPAWHNSRIKQSTGWVSANQGVDASLYQDPIDQLSARYLTDKNATFRFDASDLMPAAIGAGQEWKSMTKWFAEGKSVADVAKEIDEAWPS